MSLPSFFNVTPHASPTQSSVPAPPAWMSATPQQPQPFAHPRPVPRPAPYQVERPSELYAPRISADDAAALRERMIAQFEAILPRVLHMVCEGYTVSRAVKDLPLNPPINYGQFNRWLRRNHGALIDEAEEARTEVWADLIIEHAEGKGIAEHSTIERSKFATDQYKYLMGRQNKKRYGETKTVDVTHTISIAAALQASKQRVIEATIIEDEPIEGEFMMLGDGEDE